MPFEKTESGEYLFTFKDKTRGKQETFNATLRTPNFRRRSKMAEDMIPEGLSKSDMLVSGGIATAIPSMEYNSLSMAGIPPSISRVDLNLEANGTFHKTKYYHLMRRSEVPSLVVRRGQSFRLTVYLTTPYGFTDELSVRFFIRDHFISKMDANTYLDMKIPIASILKGEKGKWSAICDYISPDGQILFVKILSPSNCVVGKWTIEFVLTNTGEFPQTSNFRIEQALVIIFNAWNRNDDCFISDVNKRFEYILRDYGKIYRGTSDSVSHVLWKYSQYDADVLECALNAVDRLSDVQLAQQGELSRIARAVGDAVRSPSGILIDSPNGGGLVKDFKDGIDPFEWSGTAQIVQEFLKNGPVKFGTPWLASAVMVSFLRALGVPARNVTCYNWAAGVRDTSYTIDIIYSEQNYNKNVLKKDNSIWPNFTWTEIYIRSWFANANFTGWTAVTPTHGPFPLLRLNSQLISYHCDGKYFYGGINADIAIWKYLGYRVPLKLVRYDGTRVGSLVGTKAIETWDLYDMTQFYKQKRGEPLDKRIEIFEQNLQSIDIFKNHMKNTESRSVLFKLHVKKVIHIDENLKASLIIQNFSKEQTFKVTTHVSITAINDEGVAVNIIKDERSEKIMEPTTVEKVVYEVVPAIYIEKLTSNYIFKACGQAFIHETEFDFYDFTYIKVKPPEILISAEPFSILHQRTVVELGVTNPTSLTFTDVMLSLEELDSKKRRSIRKAEFEPYGTIQVQFGIVPSRYGTYHLAARLYTQYFKTVTYSRLQVK